DGEVIFKVQRQLYKIEKCDNGHVSSYCLIKPSGKDKYKLDSSVFSEVWNVSLSVKVDQDLQNRMDESDLELSIKKRPTIPQPSVKVSTLSPFQMTGTKKVKKNL